MIPLQNPPEFSDGGYWYVFEAVPGQEEDSRTAPDESGSGWTAHYATIGGTDYVVVRKPDSGALPQADMNPARILAQAQTEGSIPADRRPYGRVGGR